MSEFNTTDTQFSVGLMQAPLETEAAPLFVAPLYGHNLNSAHATEKVLLVFSTEDLALGTVVDTLPLSPNVSYSYDAAVSQAVFVNASENRSLTYDINKSWSWDGGVWAKYVPPGSDLVSLLVEPEKLF